MRKILILFALVSVGNLAGFAQGAKKFQIWTDFDPSYKLNEQWQVGGDFGYRITPSTGDQTVYIRPGITYKPGKIISFSVGLASFNSWKPDDFILAELRTFQFVKLSWPRIGDFEFNHRLGLEQRWFYLPELGLDKFTLRSRYYLEVVSPKFNLFGLGAPFFFTANVEILRDLNNNNELGRLIDHNRFTIGMGNQLTDRFRADIRYKIISFVDPLLYNFIQELEVLRIRFYYQFASS